MRASDVMSAKVATIGPQASVADAARTMLNRRVSGLPVVDDEGRLVGIVTEGDLMRRAETHTERRRSGWSALFAPTARLAAEYVKAHGRRVAEVMSREVVSVDGMARLDEIAGLLERNNIRRVPVVADGRLVGIVSRADLLRVLASGGAGPGEAGEAGDRTIRDALLAELGRQRWSVAHPADIVVADRIVHLWGVVGSEEERAALCVAAENTPGVRAVEDHTTIARLFPLR